MGVRGHIAEVTTLRYASSLPPNPPKPKDAAPALALKPATAPTAAARGHCVDWLGVLMCCIEHRALCTGHAPLQAWVAWSQSPGDTLAHPCRQYQRGRGHSTTMHEVHTAK